MADPTRIADDYIALWNGGEPVARSMNIVRLHREGRAEEVTGFLDGEAA